MRRVRLQRPFIQGMVTDQPAYELGPQHSAWAQDLVAPEGIARMRKGWTYDGNTADVADYLTAIHRNQYILADATRTITSVDGGNTYIHNLVSAGTQISTFSGLPRCVYRDTLIICPQDGITPIGLYSGGSVNLSTTATSTATTVGKATLTAGGGSFDSAARSCYAVIGCKTSARTGPYLSLRILERAASTIATLENARASAALTLNSQVQAVGFGFPCVPVYSAGTGSYDNPNDEFDGSGTVWTGGAWGEVNPASTYGDALLTFNNDSTASVAEIDGVTDSLTLSIGTTDRTDTNCTYAILRRMPFTDAQAHKGSFWGTGVAQYPNNVYVGPPGWDLVTPPGFVPPFDPTDLFDSGNSNDFVMDSIAIPTAFDGDKNVAILSSPNPLLVLKRNSVYGIYGSYPNFSTDKITDNAGCIDLRSAISGPNGQFWAGEEGIYGYVGGQVIDLTESKINREWRSLTRDFDYGTNDYCTMGEVYNHLFISMVTSLGAVNRAYVYDLRNQAWVSRFSNHKARYFFSSKVDGESEELYWVGDNDIGRVMRSAATVNGTGIAKDGDGTSPVFAAQTPQNIDGDGSIENDERMLDLAIHANVYDTAGTGTTLTVAVNTGGALEDGTNASKILTGINSDSEDRVDRHYRRAVNTKGRLHQVQLSVAAIGSNNAFTKVEVPEIVATFRTRRDRT